MFDLLLPFAVVIILQFVCGTRACMASRVRTCALNWIGWPRKTRHPDQNVLLLHVARLVGIHVAAWALTYDYL